MPLKCFNGEQEVYAFEIKGDDAWEALRESNRKTGSLRMACCGAKAVLRTSKLGTRHFAHASRGECAVALETAEHLLAKMAIVEAIQQTAWVAKPEQAGKTPSGAEWRADVLATKGNARAAFEVQWSRQDIAETVLRQERYRDAGVRGLWFFRQIDFPLSKDTPAFRLCFDQEAKAFNVLFPSPHYDPEWVKRNDPRDWGQVIPLRKFVVGALEGRLRYAPVLGRRMPLEVKGSFVECWRCKRSTGIVIELNFAASRVLPRCHDIPTSIYDMAELDSGVPQVMLLLPPALLREHGIGPLKLRSSKTEGREYLSNGCVHCDSLQGRFFDHEHVWDMKKIFEIEVEFKPEWGLLGDAQNYIDRWWFDESSGG